MLLRDFVVKKNLCKRLRILEILSKKELVNSVPHNARKMKFYNSCPERKRWVFSETLPLNRSLTFPAAALLKIPLYWRGQVWLPGSHENLELSFRFGTSGTGGWRHHIFTCITAVPADPDDIVVTLKNDVLFDVLQEVTIAVFVETF